MMTWIMLYYDALKDYKLLSDEQFGRLIRAALSFAQDGAEPELSAPEAYLWPSLQNRLIRDKESYAEKCRQSKEAADERWRRDRERRERGDQERGEADGAEPKEEPPPEKCGRIRTHTDECEQCEEKEKEESESEIKKEIEKKYDIKIKSESEIKNAREKLRAEGYSETEIDGALSRIPADAKIRSLRAYIKKAIDEERREKRIGKRVPAQNYSQRDYSGEQEAAFQRMMERFAEEEEPKQDQGGTYRPPQPGSREEQINRLKEVIANEEREKQRISGGT